MGPQLVPMENKCIYKIRISFLDFLDTFVIVVHYNDYWLYIWYLVFLRCWWLGRYYHWYSQGMTGSWVLATPFQTASLSCTTICQNLVCLSINIFFESWAVCVNICFWYCAALYSFSNLFVTLTLTCPKEIYCICQVSISIVWGHFLFKMR